MTHLSQLPWRADGHARPAPPIDPTTMPLFRGTRPRKKWRYLGMYDEHIQLCVGVVHVGPLPVSFWAIHDRSTNEFKQHAALIKVLDLPDDTVRFSGGGMSADLQVQPAGDDMEILSPHGNKAIWTKKTPMRMHGTVTLGDRTIEVDAPGLRDDTVGHHARLTEWNWSAGCGTDTHGRAIVWNLVSGIHDDPTCSENPIWIDGVARPVRVPTFADDISWVESDGARLSFTAEAERAQRDRLLLINSDYRQPFGTFAGHLPGGIEVTGFGVMEDHSAHW